jgi:hypothetical protein
VLSEPFYLNDVLVAPDLIQSLLSVHQLTVDNACSMEFDPFGLSMKDLATKRVLPDTTTLIHSTPHVLSCTPWPSPLPLLPNIVASVTPTPISSPRCRAAQPSPALEEEMISCVMVVSLVGMSGCPFLPPLLGSFDPLTSYTVTSGPPLL